MLKVVPGPQTRVIDTSFTIRVSGWRNKINEGCAVGRSRSHNKVVGKRSEKAKRDNGRGEEEEGAMGKMRARCRAGVSKNACR